MQLTVKDMVKTLTATIDTMPSGMVASETDVAIKTFAKSLREQFLSTLRREASTNHKCGECLNFNMPESRPNKKSACAHCDDGDMWLFNEGIFRKEGLL